MDGANSERRVVLAFACANLPLVLLFGTNYLGFLERPVSAWLTLYVGLSFVLHFAALWALVGGLSLLVTRGRFATWLGRVVPVAGFGFLYAFLLLDSRIFSSFRFHLNGFVLEILMQDDAFEVLGVQPSEILAYAGIGFVALIGEGLLYAAAHRLLTRWREGVLLTAPVPVKKVAIVCLVFALLTTGERLSFAALHFRGYTEATAQARVFPFYLPVTMRRFMRRFYPEGQLVRPPRAEAARYLAYPHEPVAVTGDERRLNVVWIVLEAWRADHLRADVMPNTYAFAQESLTSSRHLSGGNATRLGLFSMFYGLHPAKYQYFRDAKQGPVFFDVLKRLDYRIKVMASASLKFLGPHETIFVDVADTIEEVFGDDPAASDRGMTDRWLAWLGEQEKGKPFFSFLFFDGSHPRCHFEPGFDKFTPYLKDVKDIDQHPEKRDLLVNRYRNSLFNEDFRIGQVLDALRAAGHMDDTVVIITGDHGAEFWEHGHFTHSSAFTEQQLSVPLVLHAPGVKPGRVERMTSHMDLPATVFDLLRVKAPPASYSQGDSILSGPPRKFAVASGWKDHVYIDDEVKVVFYQANAGAALWKVTTSDDEPVADQRGKLREKSGALARCFKLFPEFLAGKR